ncbi:MAG: hypothetical protein E5X54_01590 [Mesorhizobium sp.]|nr:MAG: hypothetical protein E5X54_01590 [Mesorhizobium sp.]
MRESQDVQDEGRKWPRHDRDLSHMDQPFQLAACAEMRWRDRPITWRAEMNWPFIAKAPFDIEGCLIPCGG